jgi:hypothetical protein
MPTTTEIKIKNILTPKSVASAAAGLGITLKSKGKTDRRVKTVQSENAFITI